MTDSLFTSADPAVIDPDKNYLEEYVGEGKKFKDPVELARGKAEADAFIERLKREAEGLRNELNTRLKLEEVIDKIQSNPNNGQVQPSEKPEGGTGDAPVIKPEDIEKLVEQSILKRDSERVQSENLAKVKEKLTEAFGSDYVSHLKSAGEALGMSENDLQAVAKANPKAFLRLVGADKAVERSNDLFVPPQGQVRQINPTGDKTKSYYDALRKRDPKEYWSRSTQNQMHRDALRLGEKFFDS